MQTGASNHSRQKRNTRQRSRRPCAIQGAINMFLTPEELIELTGKYQRSAQVRALRFMGIEHKLRADGTVVVLKSHVEKVLDGVSAHVAIKDVEPNWEALNV